MPLRDDLPEWQEGRPLFNNLVSFFTGPFECVATSRAPEGDRYITCMLPQKHTNAHAAHHSQSIKQNKGSRTARLTWPVATSCLSRTTTLSYDTYDSASCSTSVRITFTYTINNEHQSGRRTVANGMVNTQRQSEVWYRTSGHPLSISRRVSFAMQKSST
jgi:hypothetical protein